MPKRRKITDAQVVELRTRRAAGESLKSLAEAFGLIPEYVSYVCRGKIHKGAGGPITDAYSVFANARLIERDGVTLSETKWAERAGLPLTAVKTRLHRGWSVEDALTTRLRHAPSEILTPPGPSIAYVVLNEGQFACIDVETIPLVKDDLWYVVKDPKSGRMYPATHRPTDGKFEFVSMRTVVLGNKPTTSYAVNWNNLDCRKANLRDVTKAQSTWRAGIRSNNKSGYTGVFWNKEKKRFIVNLVTNGITERVGRFHTLEEAVAARDRAVARTRGEFARLQTENAH
ncbi:MAG: hypothetical protein ACRYGF_17050 [Janthinobacterium lividum]